MGTVRDRGWAGSRMDGIADGRSARSVLDHRAATRRTLMPRRYDHVIRLSHSPKVPWVPGASSVPESSFVPVRRCATVVAGGFAAAWPAA